MVDKNKIKKGDKYLFIPKGLSDVKKEVTITCEPVWNPVVNDDVVKINFSGISFNYDGDKPMEVDDFINKVLSAQVSVDIATGELNIVLPKKINDNFIRRIMPKNSSMNDGRPSFDLHR